MTNQEFIESIRLEGEEWRDVVGWEGLYMVSSLGRVASLERSIHRKNRYGNNAIFVKKPHLCKPFYSKRYIGFVLCRNSTFTRKDVHRMVAESFIPNPNGYPQVDHINDNPKDNRVCNLQWCTAKVNSTKESHILALSISHIGKPSKHRKPIVSIDAKGEVCHYTSLMDAEANGYARSAIRKVLNGEQELHQGLKWMHLSDYEKTLITQDVNELSPMQ